MPLDRFARLDADKQRLILDAAQEEFARHGFMAASYNRIIQQAGVSKGAMYYYFEDKADLFGAVITRSLSGLVDVLGPAPAADGPEAFWGGVEEMFGRAVQWLGESPERARLTRSLAQSYGDPEFADAFAGIWDQLWGVIDGLLEAGSRAGAVRTDLPRGLLVRMLIAAGQAIADQDQVPLPKHRLLIDACRRLCAPV